MATNVMAIKTGEDVTRGTAPSLRINRRIENPEIPLFIRQCVIDATQWEVDGVRYNQWRGENGNGMHSDAEWLDKVIIPTCRNALKGLKLIVTTFFMESTAM